jgi:PPOX class probable F420-dependent enzyme
MGSGPRHVEEFGDPALAAALARSKRMYLTTRSASGRAGTVPVWFMVHQGALYFTTLRRSLKARRIATTGRVRVAVGAPDGPAFEGRAEWVDGHPELETEVLRVYRRKYPLAVPLFMGRWIRKRLASGESVLIRITPEASPGAGPTGALAPRA